MSNDCSKYYEDNPHDGKLLFRAALIPSSVPNDDASERRLFSFRSPGDDIISITERGERYATRNTLVDPAARTHWEVDLLTFNSLGPLKIALTEQTIEDTAAVERDNSSRYPLAFTAHDANGAPIRATAALVVDRQTYETFTDWLADIRHSNPLVQDAPQRVCGEAMLWTVADHNLPVIDILSGLEDGDPDAHEQFVDAVMDDESRFVEYVRDLHY